jgi:hypothetical protein
MTKKKHIKIEFAPGAFDQFDGTQQELDEFIAELHRMAESGELEEHSQSLDDDEAWLELTEEEQAMISAALNQPTETRH